MAEMNSENVAEMKKEIVEPVVEKKDDNIPTNKVRLLNKDGFHTTVHFGNSHARLLFSYDEKTM